jgi:hypothetical protein
LSIQLKVSQIALPMADQKANPFQILQLTRDVSMILPRDSFDFPDVKRLVWMEKEGPEQFYANL